MVLPIVPKSDVSKIRINALIFFRCIIILCIIWYTLFFLELPGQILLITVVVGGGARLSPVPVMVGESPVARVAAVPGHVTVRQGAVLHWEVVKVRRAR